LNLAITVVVPVGVTLHVGPVPEQAAPQPKKVDPLDAASVKVIGVPVAKGAEHVPGH